MVENKIFLDTDTICLNENYSMTRLLTKEKPVLEQRPEYKLEPSLFLSPNPERKGEGGLRTKGYFKKSYDNKPLISIVTVVYNGEKHLEQTIKSVLEQTYDNVEYILIDGASTDGTLDIIQRHEPGIDYWVSESDGGIYDAMNKGASLATGDYVAFLNADDWYPEKSIKTVAETIIVKEVDYVYGKLSLFNENGYARKRKPTHYKYGMPMGHQALFLKTTLIRMSPFDLSYPVAADYDMILNLIRNGRSHIEIDDVLANFRLIGISSTSSLEKEFFLVYKKHFGFIPAIVFFIRNTKQPLIYNVVQSLIGIRQTLFLNGYKDV